MSIQISPFSALIDRIADLGRVIDHVNRVRRTARSLIEAQTQLQQVAWLLHEQKVELKRQLDEQIAEAKVLKAKAAKSSKKDN